MSAVTTLPTPDPEQPSPPLSKPDLLAALDAQIKFITDDRRSTGWTRWAIWGALAPLTWLATDLLNRKETSLARVALLSLAIFAGWRLLEMVVAMFSPSSSTTSAPTRFRIMADTINAARLQLVFTTAR